ncbi:MAG: WD40 repeat protein/energy-coupling factor transporter ATP-binding protein EcfA2 [Crocinitomicaceae bacterium]|jgi:WD40 repeat protein/energy-coupling factor transporter ATP-binding protein EcfA2
MKQSNNFQLDEYYLELLNEGNLGLNSDKNQANKVKYLSNTEIARRPYPGIRPFKTTEAPIFFGRDGQAGNLVKKLNDYNFLAVIGSSGSGKSSLVRAGLIPHLFAGYHERGGADWEIGICRPGDNPISNLAAALAGVKAGSSKHDKIQSEYSEILEELTENPYGLLEVAQKMNGNDGNILIIIDQFEELFRFQRESSKMDAQHFVNLLMNVAGERDSRVYVAITMRSEYLGDCVQFRDLAESINKGQYLVPRLGRKELMRAIEGPIRMAGGEIHPSLVNKLVSQVGDNMDQLPILQHALMRTYEYWKADDTTEAVGIEHYRKAGEMKGALGQHAEEIIKPFTPAQLQIVKCIFQRITDKSSDDRGIRRPCHLNQIHEVAFYLDGKYVLGNELVSKDVKGAELIKSTSVEINEIIEILRHEDNAFLMPPNAVSLDNNPVIDISHESIMRNWEQLGVWIQEELVESLLYKRLDQARRDKLSDDKDDKIEHRFLSGALLRELSLSQEVKDKNAAWAARYNDPKSRSYRALQIQFGEENAAVDKSKETAYPLQTDQQIYKDNTAYFLACMDNEKALLALVGMEEKRAAKSRQRRIILVVLLILLPISIISTIYSSINSEKAKKSAEIAKIAGAEANIQKQIAMDSARVAVDQREIADSLANQADSLTNQAIIQADLANAEREIAVAQRRIADEQTRLAGIEIDNTIRERDRADSIAIIAQDQLDELAIFADKQEELIAEAELKSQRLQNFINHNNYRDSMVSNGWYAEYNKGTQKDIDNLLFPKFNINAAMLRDSILSDSVDSDVPNILVALETGAYSTMNFTDDRIHQLALAKVAEMIDTNAVTTHLFDSLLNNFQGLNYFKNGFGSQGIAVGWDNMGNPSFYSEHDACVIKNSSIDTVLSIYSFKKGTYSLLDFDFKTGRKLIARREEESTFKSSTKNNFKLEIHYPDPNKTPIKLPNSILRRNLRSFSEGYKDLVYVNEGTLFIYNGTLNSTRGNYNFTYAEPNIIKISKNGNLLAITYGALDWSEASSRVEIFNCSGKKLKLKRQIEIKEDATQIYFSNNGKKMYWLDRVGRFYGVDVEGEDPQELISGEGEYVDKFAFSSDEKYTAFAISDKDLYDGAIKHNDIHTIRVSEEATGNIENTFKWHSRYVESLAFSDDNSQLISANLNNLFVWNRTPLPLDRLSSKNILINKVLSESLHDLGRTLDGSKYGSEYDSKSEKLAKFYYNYAHNLDATNPELSLAMAQFEIENRNFQGAKIYLNEAKSNIENVSEIYTTARGFAVCQEFDEAVQLLGRIKANTQDEIRNLNFQIGMIRLRQAETISDETSRMKIAKLAIESFEEIDLNDDMQTLYRSEVTSHQIYALILAGQKRKVYAELKKFSDDTDGDAEEKLRALAGIKFNRLSEVESNLNPDNNSYFFNNQSLLAYSAMYKSKTNPTDLESILSDLEKLADTNYRNYYWIKWQPELQFLNGNERYIKVLEKIKANYFKYSDF